MAISYKQKKKIYTAIAPHLYDSIVRDADYYERSISGQIEFIIKQYYEERFAQGIHHDKRGQREIQD